MNRTHFGTGLATALLVLLAPSWSACGADEPVSLKEVFKNHFLVGTAVSRSMVQGGPAFRRSTEQTAADVAQLKRNFNQVVAENDMKWQLIHPRAGAEGYSFAAADALLEFSERERMQVAGHTLVWHSQTPDWVFAGTNPPPAAATNAAGANPARRGFGRYAGPRASREELLQRMHDHIQTVVGRYRGRVKVWDVVNEAVADNGPDLLRSSLWREIIGPDFIAQAFRFAHEADPQAVLRYNDYGLENPDKRGRLIRLIQSLRDQGVPVHAIGSQTHVNVGTTFEVMDRTLTELAALGLPVHITELDVNGAEGGQRNTGADVSGNAASTQGGLVADADRRQAETYAGLFRAFVKHRKSVPVVTFWGVNDGVSWRSMGRPLLFDGENRPKPAFAAVVAEATVAGAPDAGR